MIKETHKGHVGINGTTRRAKESMFWPGMYNDIKQFVENCSTCLSYSKGQ